MLTATTTLPLFCFFFDSNCFFSAHKGECEECERFFSSTHDSGDKGIYNLLTLSVDAAALDMNIDMLQTITSCDLQQGSMWLVCERVVVVLVLPMTAMMFLAVVVIVSSGGRVDDGDIGYVGEIAVWCGVVVSVVLATTGLVMDLVAVPAL
ncbi:Hypothetical predicted protein [Olea europaea subsp. europaea]|uniref:Transmembrane protein n=1 Tax=Olea europaea subsp. europaea TaxID=158383 RepID=A0A8S0TN65_OLEEU|nr:Hypothetical predicted protein [Olea europaea subsp. europaea]